jgi:hypothetical protein
MLDDPEAIRIISAAKQKNVATPRLSHADFEHIFDDFFSGKDLTGQTVLDLGPGQYDFGRMVRDRGGVTHHIDKDPAVVELGRYLGFEVSRENLTKFDTSSRRGRYDGLFCKFSINAFWFVEEGIDIRRRLADYTRDLDAMLAPRGWGWIAPWNGNKTLGPAEQAEVLAAQAAAFVACGWQALEMPKRAAQRYGVDGTVANHALFVKGLPLPPALQRVARLALPAA